MASRSLHHFSGLIALAIGVLLLLLGPYDFMDIYKAPNVSTAHKVSLISRSEGAIRAESWPALGYDRFLQVLEEVSP